MVMDWESLPRGRAEDGLHARLVPYEPALHVGVAEEGDAGFQITECLVGLAGRDDVLILVVRRAVEDLEGFDRHRTAGKSHNVVGIFAREGLEGPHRGIASYRIEPFEIFLTGGGAVVIAADDHGTVRAYPVADQVWIGAVADQVAAADDAIVGAMGLGEDSMQSFQVGV